MALSFGQVRDYVLAEIGGEAPVESRLMILMQAALVEVASRLSLTRERKTMATLSLVADQQAYDLPGDSARLSDIRIDGRTIRQGHPFRNETVTASLDVNGHPAFWWEDKAHAQVVFEPAVTEATDAVLTYLSVVDGTLYDLNDDSERVWRYVALPDEVHYAYAKYVLGQALVPTDPGLGAMMGNAAMSEIAEWQRTRQRAYRPTMAMASEGMRRHRSFIPEHDAARFRLDLSEGSG